MLLHMPIIYTYMCVMYSASNLNVGKTGNTTDRSEGGPVSPAESGTCSINCLLIMYVSPYINRLCYPCEMFYVKRSTRLNVIWRGVNVEKFLVTNIADFD